MPDFDFRDMLGGADAKLNRLNHPDLQAKADALTGALALLAADREFTPLDIVAVMVGKLAVRCHVCQGAAAAHSLLDQLTAPLEGYRNAIADIEAGEK